MKFLVWLADFFGWCWKHKVRTEWDGERQTYVCPLENPPVRKVN